MCPARVDWSSPDDAFQILTVLSQLPLAICLPSELKQTLTTRRLLKNTKSVPIYKRRHSIQGDGTYLCPARGEPMGSPVDASHSRTLSSLMYPSPLHDAMLFEIETDSAERESDTVGLVSSNKDSRATMVRTTNAWLLYRLRERWVSLKRPRSDIDGVGEGK